MTFVHDIQSFKVYIYIYIYISFIFVSAKILTATTKVLLSYIWKGNWALGSGSNQLWNFPDIS